MNCNVACLVFIRKVFIGIKPPGSKSEQKYNMSTRRAELVGLLMKTIQHFLKEKSTDFFQIENHFNNTLTAKENLCSA